MQGIPQKSSVTVLISLAALIEKGFNNLRLLTLGYLIDHILTTSVKKLFYEKICTAISDLETFITFKKTF